MSLDIQTSKPRHYPARVVHYGGVNMMRCDVPVVAVDFRIDQGPIRGTVITWYGFFSNEAQSRRVFDQLANAGWARRSDLFSVNKNGGPRKPRGLGSKRVLVTVVVESFRPEPTEDDPHPKMVRRHRIQFINPWSNGLRARLTKTWQMRKART